MCGFIGYVSASKEPVDLLKALPRLLRRGPDSWGIWQSPDKSAGLLHTRLAVVDKDSRADQPFSDLNLGLRIVFSGEIYNYQQLKSELSDYHFRTQSDTEIILAAYAKFGIEGFNRLNGMFCFSLADERQRKVILVRDRIGKKPLFLALADNKSVFGSSLLDLCAVDKDLRKINEGVLRYYWENSFIMPYDSALSGVTPVLPGDIIELGWDAGMIKKARLEPKKIYVYNGEPIKKINETVAMLLNTAVSRRLNNNPVPAILVSGGIDSTLICQVAKGLCGKGLPGEIKAVTLRSFVPMFNDEFYARFAAGRIKVDLELISLKMRGLDKLIIRSLDLQDEPLGMPAFFLLERLVCAASSRSRVLLTGDGGDEVFLGYGKPADWLGCVHTDIVNKAQMKTGLEAAPWMSAWAVKAVTEVFLGHMLSKVDRASAQQGVEIRCPLLDWDLVSYARSLPFEVLTSGGRSKALLKDQLKGWPGWFVNRPKIGFAYNLRWHWGMSNYAGLRQAVDRRAVDLFGCLVPVCLRKDPRNWTGHDIWQKFDDCWRLLAWSRFLNRLQEIGS